MTHLRNCPYLDTDSRAGDGQSRGMCTCPKKPTKAQRRALQLTVDDGGTLVLGGQDGRAVRRDVIFTCQQAGWLVWKASGSFFEEQWRITAAGREVLK